MPDLRPSLLALLLALGPLPAQDARALLLQGRALQLRGGGEDPRAAAALYRRVIDQMPDSAEAHLRLSEALQEANDLEGAVVPAARAVELAPQNAEAQAHLALLQYQRAQRDTDLLPVAAKELRAATKRLPQDPELWARLGEVSEQLKDGEGAMKAWLRLGRMRPGFLPAWERAFIHARALQDYAGKREALLALNAHQPEERHLRLLEELAREQIKLGYLAHAEESFLLLAHHLPQEAGLWENISLIRIQTSRYAEALETLITAESIKETPALTFRSAQALMNLGLFADAEARLRPLVNQPLEGDGLGDGVQMLYAECLLLEGKGRELLDFLMARKPRPRTDAEALVFKTQALVNLGEWPAAAGCLREGIARFPQQPFFAEAAKLPEGALNYRLFSRKESRAALERLHLEGMAALWQEFQRWDKCLDALDRARALGLPPSVESLVLRSQALDQLGHKAESLKALREAQALEAENPLVQNNLGYLLLELGGQENLAEAAALIDRSAKATPTNGNVMDSLGWAQFKLGRPEAAEETLRRAAELAPFSPEVRLHLGDVLVARHKLAEAAEQWERALAFVFPGRAALEKRLAQLRVRIAKEAAAKAEAAPDTATDADDGDEE